MDIGSRIDGFITHLLTFMPVQVVDVRPLTSTIEGLSFIHDDATRLSQFADGSLESVSTLHAIEHFGLGRYGDTIDPDGYRKFLSSLERVLAPGGRLYLGTPVGRERLEFNGGRVFHPQTIIGGLPGLKLESFSLVGDDGHLVSDCPVDRAANLSHGCGLFEFTKPVG